MAAKGVNEWYHHLYNCQQDVLAAGELQQFFRGHMHLNTLLRKHAGFTQSANESIISVSTSIPSSISPVVQPAVSEGQGADTSGNPWEYPLRMYIAHYINYPN